MPTRIEFTPGGEFLIPYAKRELKALTKRAQDMGLSALSRRTLIDPEGHIDYQYNKFGIDTIKIQWGGELSHGFVTWPASDDAEYGWGKPFTGEDGTAINPPLGTVLQAGADFAKSEREVLIRPGKKPGEYRVKRRLPIILRGRNVWFSEDSSAIISYQDKSVYSRGNKIASVNRKNCNLFDGLSAYGGIVMSACVANETVDGVNKKYLWAVVAPDKGNRTPADNRIISCRTVLRKKIKLIPDPNDPGKKKEYTEWTIIGSHDVVTDPAFMVNGQHSYDVTFVGRNANEEGTEAAFVYCSQSANGPSGYIKIGRTPFSAEVVNNNRNVDLPYAHDVSQSDTVYSDTKTETSVPLGDGFVFDVGYRGNELFEAKITLKHYMSRIHTTISSRNDNNGLFQDAACASGVNTYACCYAWRVVPVFYGIYKDDRDGHTSFEAEFTCGDFSFPLLKMGHSYTSTSEKGPTVVLQQGVDGCEVSVGGGPFVGVGKSHITETPDFVGSGASSLTTESRTILHYDVSMDFMVVRVDKYSDSNTSSQAGSEEPNIVNLAVTEESTEFFLIHKGVETKIKAPYNDTPMWSKYYFSARKSSVHFASVPLSYQLPPGTIIIGNPESIDAASIFRFTNVTMDGMFRMQVTPVKVQKEKTTITMLSPHYIEPYRFKSILYSYVDRISHERKTGRQPSQGKEAIMNYEARFLRLRPNHAHYVTPDNRHLLFYSIPYTQNRPLAGAGAIKDGDLIDFGSGNSERDGWNELPEDITWLNFITENNPVDLTKTTGPRPRFNDIGVI